MNAADARNLLSRRTMYFAVLATCGALFFLDIASLNGNFNDKALHRVIAYWGMDAGLDAEIRERLNHCWDWRSDAPALMGSETVLVYRLNIGGGYLITAYLTRLLERLPLVSAFQSVFLAHLTVHIGAFLLAVTALGSIDLRKHRLPWVVLLSATLAPWIIGPHWALPYVNEFFAPQSWKTPYPRGPAGFLIFNAFLCALHGRDGGAWNRRALVWSAVLFCCGTAIHVPSGILYGAVSILGVTVVRIRIVRRTLEADGGFWRNLRWLAAFSGLVFMGKLAVFSAYLIKVGAPLGELYTGSRVRALAAFITVFGIWYLLASTWLLTRYQKLRTDLDSATKSISDGVAVALVLATVLIVGGYTLGNTRFDALDSTTYFLSEVNYRILAFGHMTWWVLFAIVAWKAITSLNPAWAETCARALAVALLLTGANAAYRAFGPIDADAGLRYSPKVSLLNHRLLETKLTDVCRQEPPVQADYFIYHAVANEYRARLLGR